MLIFILLIFLVNESVVKGRVLLKATLFPIDYIPRLHESEKRQNAECLQNRFYSNPTDKNPRLTMPCKGRVV